MRYSVYFCDTGELKQETNNLELALQTARAMTNWNIPCFVLDRDTFECLYKGVARN